jgi:ElaB/YqjD/DUF883 family membrane-anchored ribosome-binding protein
MTSRTEQPATWQYERDAEATRHRLANGLDELNSRLTPGQVFDEMLTYARGSGGTFFRALTNASRENPIPSLLIAAGAMMFLTEKLGLKDYMGSRSGDSDQPSRGTNIGQASARAGNAAASAAVSGMHSAADSVRSGMRSATDFAGEQTSKVADSVRTGAEAVSDTVSSAARQARETAHDLRDQASEAGDKIRRGAQSLTDTVQDYSAAVSDQVAEGAERATRQTLRSAQQAKDSLTSFVHEQPLVSAAIGLAVGAAIAAVLPKTKTEDEFMGETSDSVKDAMGEVASDQFQKAKTAAGSVAREASNAAQREGLGPSQAADAVRQLGEKIKTVASDTKAAAETEVRDFADKADRK